MASRLGYVRPADWPLAIRTRNMVRVWVLLLMAGTAIKSYGPNLEPCFDVRMLLVSNPSETN